MNQTTIQNPEWFLSEQDLVQVIHTAASKRPNGTRHDTSCNRFVLAAAIKAYRDRTRTLNTPVISKLEQLFRPTLDLPPTYRNLTLDEIEIDSLQTQLPAFLAMTDPHELHTNKRAILKCLRDSMNELCCLSLLSFFCKRPNIDERVVVTVQRTVDPRSIMFFRSFIDSETFTENQLEDLAYFLTHCIFSITCYGLLPVQRELASSLQQLAGLLWQLVPRVLALGHVELLLETMMVLRVTGFEPEQALAELLVPARSLLSEITTVRPPWRTRSGKVFSTWHLVAVLMQCLWMPEICAP